MKTITSKELSLAIKDGKTLKTVASMYNVKPETFFDFLTNSGISNKAARFFIRSLKGNDKKEKRTKKDQQSENTQETTETTVIPNVINEAQNVAELNINKNADATVIAEPLIITSIAEMHKAFETHEVSDFTVIETAEDWCIELEIKAEELRTSLGKSEKECKEIFNRIQDLFTSIYKEKELLRIELKHKNQLKKSLSTLNKDISQIHISCKERRKKYEESHTILIIEDESIECSDSGKKVYVNESLLNIDVDTIASIQNKIFQTECAEDMTVKLIKRYAKIIAVHMYCKETYKDAIIKVLGDIDQKMLYQLLSNI